MADRRAQLSGISGFREGANQVNYGVNKKLSSWSSRLLRFSFAFVAIDVFPANKQHQDLGVIDLRSEDAPCWLNKCWSKIYQPICMYLISKPLATLLLRATISHLNTSRHWSPSRALRIDQLRWLLNLIGDPFCTKPQLAPIAYLGTTSSVLALNFLAPYYFRNAQPFDCSLVRFLLDSKREQRRIDRSIMEKVEFALAAVEQRRKELSSLLEVSPRFRALRSRRLRFYEGDILLADLVKLMEQSNLLRRLKQNLQTIRPATFRADSLQYYQRTFFAVFVSMLTVNFVVFAFVTVIFSYIYKQDRCDRRMEAIQNQQLLFLPPISSNISVDCRYSSLFTQSEVLISVEIFTSMDLFTYPTSSLFLTVIFLILNNQLDLIESTRRNLSNLLANLCELSQQAAPETDKKSALSSVESTMYINIIGLWTFEVESRRNVALIARLMTFYLILLFLLTFAAFSAFIPTISASSAGCTASGPIKPMNYQSGVLAILVWSLVWVSSNMLILVCALIPSRAARLRGLVASILAQTTRITNKQRQRLYTRQEDATNSQQSPRIDAGRREMDANDPLLLLWRKIVLSSNFDKDYHSVSVFNFKLTYRRALELNFYVAALFSLLSTKW